MEYFTPTNDEEVKWNTCILQHSKFGGMKYIGAIHITRKPDFDV